MTEDATLVAQALKNGPAGFGPIVERYKGAMFGIALARLRNFHDAEDLTQEAFVQAFQRLRSIRDREKLGAWLRSIVIHMCANQIKRQVKRTELEDTIQTTSPKLQGAGNKHDTQAEVMGALCKLSRVQRESVTMFYISGYSVEEVAAIQEVPEGTVKSRLYNARLKLKEEMIKMVSDTLKENAPGGEFSQRVLKMLSRYPDRNLYPGNKRFYNALNQLDANNRESLEGIDRALDSPHWPTRAFTVKLLRNVRTFSDECLEPLLRKAVRDSNRQVRRLAGSALVDLSGRAGNYKALTPIITSMLMDPSNHVRRKIAGILCRMPAWIAHLPVEKVSEAVLSSPNANTRSRMEQLLHLVLGAKETS